MENKSTQGVILNLPGRGLRARLQPAAADPERRLSAEAKQRPTILAAVARRELIASREGATGWTLADPPPGDRLTRSRGNPVPIAADFTIIKPSTLQTHLQTLAGVGLLLDFWTW